MARARGDLIVISGSARRKSRRRKVIEETPAVKKRKRLHNALFYRVTLALDRHWSPSHFFFLAFLASSAASLALASSTISMAFSWSALRHGRLSNQSCASR
jgi:hypothetical protein